METRMAREIEKKKSKVEASGKPNEIFVSKKEKSLLDEAKR